jgi:hypothetical protein
MRLIPAAALFLVLGVFSRSAQADVPTVTVNVTNNAITGGSTQCSVTLGSFADSVTSQNVTVYGPGSNGLPVEHYESFTFNSPENGPGRFTKTFYFTFTNMVPGGVYSAEWYVSGVTDGEFPIISPGFYWLTATQKFEYILG